MDIRWDTALMAELSSSLGTKSGSLAVMRQEVHEICRRHRATTLDLRHLAIASIWAQQRAADLMERRGRLLDAEAALLGELQIRPPGETLLPPLHSRSSELIEAELDAALESVAWQSNGFADSARGLAELRAAELTYELAVAQRNQHLMAEDLPDPVLLGIFAEIIDFLGYQIARSRPTGTPNLVRVTAATEEIRRLLDESWFRDVGRADLIAIQEVLADLSRADIDAVIGRLSTDELYRWFHEFDGVRGGNLNEQEESNLFALIAGRAGAATLFRLAGAEGGTRFHEIAAAVRDRAPAEVAFEFIETCAASAQTSDDALVAALAGMADLDARQRTIVATSLHQQELLDPLATATGDFIRRQGIERDSPLVVEFFEGLAGAIATTVTTIADLSVAGLFDRHQFREAWADVAGLVQLAFHDPIAFVEIVLDIETLRHNPARWTGAAAATVATAGVGRLARIGRLGQAARSAAQWLKSVGRFVLLDAKRLNVRARHVSATLEEIAAAVDAADVAEALSQLRLVEAAAEDLDDLIDVFDDQAE